MMAATRGSFDCGVTNSFAINSDCTTTRAGLPTASTSHLIAMIDRWVSDTSRELRTRMTHGFRAFAQLDPELPDELAPLSAPRTRAAEIFDALYTSLAPSSQRHFDAVAAS